MMIIVSLGALLSISVIGVYWTNRHQQVSLWQGVWMLLVGVFSMALATDLVKFRASQFLWHLWLLLLMALLILGLLGLCYVGCCICCGVWLNRRIRAYRLVNLTILSQITLICVLIGLFILSQYWPQMRIGFDVLLVMVAYFIFWWCAFGAGFLQYRFQNEKRSKQIDFILILGAMLTADGEMTSALKRRLDIAFKIGRQRRELKSYLMSGGRTGNSKIAESEVMRNYALKNGIPASLIQVETHSTSTFENFQYSKDVLDTLRLSPKIGVFVTDDYHVYRAAILANQNGMTTNSISAKTKRTTFWYGYMREFYAIMFAKKWSHLITIMILVGFILVNAKVRGY